MNRGHAYKSKGDYDKAIADFSTAVEIDGKSTAAYMNRSRAYESKGDYDSAIADYIKAIEIDGKFAPAYFNRGVVYKLKGDYDSAIADYEKALQLNPNEQAIKTNLAEAKKEQLSSQYYDEADLCLDKGDSDGAIAACNKALSIEEGTMLYIMRGNAYRKKKAYDLAIKDLNKAIELDVDGEDSVLSLAYSDRGAVYLEVGDYDRAIADYEKTLALDSGDLTAVNGLKIAKEAKASGKAAPQSTSSAAAAFCPNCGTKATEGVKFCANCGTAIAGAPAAAPAPASAPPAAAANTASNYGNSTNIGDIGRNLTNQLKNVAKAQLDMLNPFKGMFGKK
jgi:tetratricopeptide (TPR) repeat protein